MQADGKTTEGGAEEKKPAIAQSCAGCGHIRGALEAEDHCGKCGARPASWVTAAVTSAAADLGEPAVGDMSRDEPNQERGSEPMELFQTSPPGTSGVNVNPELRVRY